MNNLTCVCVTAPVESVLKKLKKSNIAAYNVKKEGAAVNFCVRDENIKKVFAIFKHPCYNIRIKKKSKKNAFLSFSACRFGVFIGFALFVCAVAIAQNFVFKITVTGSGSYLREEVVNILGSQGVKCGSFYKGVNKPLVQARILALPNVTFCSVTKSGSVVVVDVQIDEEQSLSPQGALKSTVRGKVEKIVALSGTPVVAAGDCVEAGDTLIAAYNIASDGGTQSCIAAGYAVVSVSAVISVPAREDNEDNAQAALKAAELYSENVVERSLSVKVCADGVIYEVSFVYTVTVSVNME